MGSDELSVEQTARATLPHLYLELNNISIIFTSILVQLQDELTLAPATTQLHSFKLTHLLCDKSK